MQPFLFGSAVIKDSDVIIRYQSALNIVPPSAAYFDPTRPLISDFMLLDRYGTD
jgi:hypothetical protein